MALYNFYCGTANGAATHFDVRELEDDAAARRHAAALLREHRSSTQVEIVQGDRDLAPVLRDDGGAAGPVDPEILEGLRRVDGQGDLAFIATTPDGVVVYWNEAARRLYGWEEGEALGRNILDVTPALQSRAAASRVMKALRAGQTWQGEMVLRRADGTPFSAFVTDIPIGAIAEGRGVIVGISVEASQRRRLDARRPELEALVRSVAGGAVGG